MPGVVWLPGRCRDTGRLPGGSVHLLGLSGGKGSRSAPWPGHRSPWSLFDSTGRSLDPGAWSRPPAGAQGLLPRECWSLGGAGVSLRVSGQSGLTAPRAAPGVARQGAGRQEQPGPCLQLHERQGPTLTGCEPWGTCLGTWALGPESTLGSRELFGEPPALARKKRGPREKASLATPLCLERGARRE